MQMETLTEINSEAKEIIKSEEKSYPKLMMCLSTLALDTAAGVSPRTIFDLKDVYPYRI
jgi:hypothetical protein